MIIKQQTYSTIQVVIQFTMVDSFIIFNTLSSSNIKL